MWEVYLPPFEAAVRAGAAIAHGVVQRDRRHAGARERVAAGRRAPASGGDFRGLVVSDWTGVEELLKHGIAAERWEAASRALGAGVDIEMSSTTY